MMIWCQQDHEERGLHIGWVAGGLVIGGDVGAIGDEMMVMDSPFVTSTCWFDAGSLTK